MKPVAAQVRDCFNQFRGSGPSVWGNIGHETGLIWEWFHHPAMDNPYTGMMEFCAVVDTELGRRLGK